jgi:F0F1-type ATP synthase membrane subunit c/vacuolar-type H+-ATPase subunit K
VFVAVPILLLTSKFGEEWARHYAAHVSIAALAVVIVLRARSVDRRPTEELWWVCGGLLAVGLVTCLAIIGAGTSVGGLLDGVIRQPLHQGDAFTLPLLLSSRVWVFDAVALSGAIGYWYVTRNRKVEPSLAWISMVSILSIVIGLEMALAVIGKTLPADSLGLTGYPFSLLAFAWVALIPMHGASDSATSFARLFLPPLAVLQALHAFPVAGSQVFWSTFLLIPVGAICVANGVRGLALSVGDDFERRGLMAIGAVASLVVLLFVANATLREPLRSDRRAYDAAVSLGLPGATSIRLAQPEVSLYRNVAFAIDKSCKSFVTLPGMDSFYVWTEQEPPTGYNATAWVTLFDDAHQQRVIDDTRSIDGLCLLRNIPIAEGWGGGRIPPGPLVRYLHRGFQPLARFGAYELLKREDSGGAH